MDEKRIYAVAAHRVTTQFNGEVVQPAGRMSAQFGHATSKMKMHRMVGVASKKLRLKMADEKITTLHKTCRDTLEMDHVRRLLEKAKIAYYTFEDENPDAYGAGEVTTAFATVPVTKAQIEGILDYLPLFASPSDN